MASVVRKVYGGVFVDKIQRFPVDFGIIRKFVIAMFFTLGQNEISANAIGTTVTFHYVYYM